MLRIALAVALTVAAGAAYAQFNRCGMGFCPNGAFTDGFRPPGSSIPPPSCAPGNATGEMDFSVCSNLAVLPALVGN
jgi:hypothetical protein